MEDQADRVGLRYAYEAGYDITKGPRLWNRFAKKYGEGNKVANFFFSDHSQSAARATKLEKEIAYNYPDGPKPDGPARQARRPEAPARTVTVAAPLAGVPAGAQALAAAPPPPVSSAAPAGTDRREIKAGMTANEVRQLLGDPQAEVVFAREDPVDLPGPHGGVRGREGHGRQVLEDPRSRGGLRGPRTPRCRVGRVGYFLRATPSSASFAAMSAPAVSTFTSLSMKRTLPSLPM